MADSFAPTALFLDCNHLYHKLRASNEALACGYCVSRLRRWGVLVGNLCSGGDESDESDKSEARHGAQVCKLRFPVGAGYNPAFLRSLLFCGVGEFL